MAEGPPGRQLRRVLQAEGIDSAKVLRLHRLSSWDGKKDSMMEWRRQKSV